MFDPADPDHVVAIFDWDMTTLGDPLIDLGTLLNYWPDPDDDSSVVGLAHVGMERMGLSSRREVVIRYGELSGIDVSRADWYAAFARWKTATVVQQLHHRWVVGDSTDERMATVADGIGRLIGGAEMFIAADKGN
jgi:aminoglycoside phosphotransferase (APT) family kinase protein